MSNVRSDDCVEGQDQGEGRIDENVISDEDLIMEQILENINTTPVGQVLKKIASLPEVRREKVLDIRRQLTEGKYNLNERLDVALDKVLDELTT
ncbi:MAG: flagellar biosynthesis anti-sigma factor FlgM [Planctomycetota bacterium]|nr:MAG: flagellar biosynthesis anti-sigma factor FlgM [Planctomycetota bacterium]